MDGIHVRIRDKKSEELYGIDANPRIEKDRGKNKYKIEIYATYNKEKVIGFHKRCDYLKKVRLKLSPEVAEFFERLFEKLLGEILTKEMYEFLEDYGESLVTNFVKVIVPGTILISVDEVENKITVDFISEDNTICYHIESDGEKIIRERLSDYEWCKLLEKLLL